MHYKFNCITVNFDRTQLFKGETKVALNNVESDFRVIETEVYA